MKKVFNFELPTGQMVKVDYNSRYFSEDSICLHFDFHGEAISETGYKSHFFGDMTNSFEPPIKEIEVHAKQLIEEFSGIKFDAQVQRQLLF